MENQDSVSASVTQLPTSKQTKVNQGFVRPQSRLSNMWQWIAGGTPWVWLNAGAVTISVIMVLGLLGLIVVRGGIYFWPSDVVQVQLHSEHVKPGQPVSWLGVIWDSEIIATEKLEGGEALVPAGLTHVERFLIKSGNRDMDGFDFRWIYDFQVKDETTPKDALVIERREWGNFYGFIQGLKERGKLLKNKDAQSMMTKFQSNLDRALELHNKVAHIEKVEIGSINFKLDQLRLLSRKYELENALTAERIAQIAKDEQDLKSEYDNLTEQRDSLYRSLHRDVALFKTADGRDVEIPLSHIVAFTVPNQLGFVGRLQTFFENIVVFVSTEPREANTEGGVFPAIFGTVIMVLIMSVVVTPFGVIAAVYLREYAKQGFVTRSVRVAVNNLAGVPSIVYGVFGLGFFVYFLGGSIDDLFYPEAAPAPVFGTSGLMWASLTLALLTVPVVIVATEEGLSRIPRSLREGSYALGATRFETLMKIIVPMASPAIMTGVILAVARAAGEVAPLMLVGVVKLAPTLPLDGNAPFLHLDRKFMHLGFHIYDVGFQSPNVEAARPLVYATSALLVAIIGVLNLTAVAVRNNLREKYKALDV